MKGVPVLTGGRTVLRRMRIEDVARQAEFNQDLELYELDCAYPPPGSPTELARSFYEARIQPNADRAPFAIEADQLYIGYCGLTGLTDQHGNGELGIMIGDRAYWGRGYGREVVELLLQHGFADCGLRRIALTTHADNQRAIRCYASCGFVEEGRPRQVFWSGGRYVDLVEMSILRTEWAQGHIGR